MSAPALARYESTLAGLERKARMRTLLPRQGVDFTSNDYLGIANAPRLKVAILAAIGSGVPVGAGGSRLLRGNHSEHELLEAEAASFFGAERVLYFGSGYAANVALFSTLPRRDDLIVYDQLMHASAHEGISASRAKAVAVPHNNPEAFEQVIRSWRRGGGSGRPWLVVESLYSMDGDLAPVTLLAEFAERHDGFLVVDEAHASGIYGPGGRGLTADLEGRTNILVLHTCGKALGVSGALLALPEVLAKYLVNRNFIYSTAPSPLMAAGVREALRMLTEEPERRARLRGLKDFAGEQLRTRLGMTPSNTQILPVILGDNARALRIAELMRAEGFDIRAIRPPTVPDGTARLRISITLNVDEGLISELFDRLAIAVRGGS
jgi:8-amino-7-oxononanoate synthase